MGKGDIQLGVHDPDPCSPKPTVPEESTCAAQVFTASGHEGVCSSSDGQYELSRRPPTPDPALPPPPAPRDPQRRPDTGEHEPAGGQVEVWWHSRCARWPGTQALPRPRAGWRGSVPGSSLHQLLAPPQPSCLDRGGVGGPVPLHPAAPLAPCMESPPGLIQASPPAQVQSRDDWARWGGPVPPPWWHGTVQNATLRGMGRRSPWVGSARLGSHGA